MRTHGSQTLGCRSIFAGPYGNGMRDMPSVPFTERTFLGEIPQTKEDLVFGRQDPWQGSRDGRVRKIENGIVREIVRSGKMISSAFFAWQGEDEDRKGRFVGQFKRQNKYWPIANVPEWRACCLLPSICRRMMCSNPGTSIVFTGIYICTSTCTIPLYFATT